MPEQTGLFTYPEGWKEMLASLDFIPEEQRELFLEQLVEFSCFIFF